MIIEKSWTIIDLVKNIKRLKEEYLFYLAFFSSTINEYEVRKVTNVYIESVKKKFYELDIKEWQIDKCWEYMNDDICYQDLFYVIKRIENKNKKC